MSKKKNKNKRINFNRTWDDLSLTDIIDICGKRVLPSLKDDILSRINEDMEEMRNTMPSYPWYIPGIIKDVSFKYTVNDFHIHLSCVATLYYTKKLTEKTELIGEDLFSAATQLDRDELEKFICSRFTRMVSSFVEKLENSMALYEAVFSENDLPPQLGELLMNGHTDLNGIEVQSDMRSTPAPTSSKIPGNAKHIFCGITGLGEFFLTTIPFSKKKRSVSASLGFDGIHNEFPVGTLAGGWLLVNALSKEYAEANFEPIEKPHLTIQFGTGEITSVVGNGPSINIPPIEGLVSASTASSWSQKVIQKIKKQEQNLKQESSQQRKILNSLNPTTLGIIQLIYKEGRFSFTALKSKFKSPHPISSSNLDKYYDQANFLKIPLKGEMVYVLDEIVVHGEYTRYYALAPNKNIDPEVENIILSAKPSDYTIDDLPNFTSDGRDQWLIRQSKMVGHEQTVITALTQIPKTIAAKFIKSTEGINFVSRLPEEYKKSLFELLDTLPGCKNILAKLQSGATYECLGAGLTGFFEQKPTKKRVTVSEYISTFSLGSFLNVGRHLNRRFILHIGPTNSGKTYDALMALRHARKGVYLGPLRLLALEMYDRLNEDNYPCSLLTGEERQETFGACITASTIEMANYETRYDIAVIDECQMLQDTDRGCHWLKAITTLNADEIHLCMAPESQSIIESLLSEMGCTWETKIHERLAPLEWAGTFKSLEDVQPGDALIAFSRRNVLSIAAQLQTLGIEASVIYGNLPPQSRREEVRRFTAGETTVVVATDAIGMGISLPIRRVIFCESTKYDGRTRRNLTYSEILQIAGRAGRYGIYDKGYVLTMSDARLIKKALNSKPAQINQIYLPFPDQALDTKYKIGTMLRAWNRQDEEEVLQSKDNGMVHSVVHANMQNALELLGHLERNLPKEELKDRRLIFSFINCPVDSKNGRLINYWYNCCINILHNKPIEPPHLDSYDLEDCEIKYKALDIQHQMGRRGGVEIDNSQEKERLARKINAFLRESKQEFLRRCSNCGCVLPINTPFGMCQKCYEEMRRNQYDDWWDDDY